MKQGLASSLHSSVRRLPWTSMPRFGLAVLALIANGVAASSQVSFALFVAAVVLAIVDGVSLGRAWPFVLAMLSGVGCVAAGWLAGSPTRALVDLGARLLAGLTWVAWAGLTCRWPELRRGLQRLNLHAVAETMELSIVHGDLLLGELARGREAIILRHGGHDLRPRTVGMLLAGTIERAFTRAKALDDTRALRAGVVGPLNGESVLRFDNVSVQGCCGPARLVEISLSIGKGEWIALAGPSGSGKTTLLRTAAGLFAPSSGCLLRFGQPVIGRGVSARVDGRVALVFQDPHDQILGATPVEDVAWGLRQRGSSPGDADTQARATLDSIGIGPLADRPIHELSFGERKRVAFAAALAIRPALLLCDEPTMGLDPVAAVHLVTALEFAAASETAVIWATHDLLTFPQPTQRMVLVRAGRIVFDGARAEGMRIDSLREAGLAL